MKKKVLRAFTLSAAIGFIFCLLILFFLSFYACREKFSTNNTALDFENDEELDLFRWKCRSRFSISPEYAAHGTRSLKMEFFATQQVGFSTSCFQHNWSNAQAFQFYVYNPSAKTQNIYIRISDDITNGDPLQSYERKLIISSGENLISIPVAKLCDSFSRKLNLHDIRGFYVYMKDIPFMTVLYFDCFYIE